MINLDYDVITQRCYVNLQDITIDLHYTNIFDVRIYIEKSMSGICILSQNEICMNSGYCYIGPVSFKKIVGILKRASTLGEIFINYTPKRFQLYKNGRMNVRCI